MMKIHSPTTMQRIALQQLLCGSVLAWLRDGGSGTGRGEVEQNVLEIGVRYG